MTLTLVSLFAGVGGPLDDLYAFGRFGSCGGQGAASDFSLLREAVAVGADDNAVSQRVLAPLGLRREVVNVAPSRVPAADHAHVAVEAPQGVRPSVARLVNADGRDHVGPALVPGRVQAIPFSSRLAEFPSMFTKTAVVALDETPLAAIRPEALTHLPTAATALNQDMLHA